MIGKNQTSLLYHVPATTNQTTTDLYSSSSPIKSPTHIPPVQPFYQLQLQDVQRQLTTTEAMRRYNDLQNLSPLSCLVKQTTKGFT